MRIAVNTRFLLKNKLEGIGWFTYEIMKRVTQNHPEHEFHFLFDRSFAKEFIFSENVKGHVVYPQARHPFLWHLWFEYSIPFMLNKIQPDVFLSPDGFLSLKSSCKTLITIHDLAFEHFPDHVPDVVRKFYQKYTPRFAKKAKRITTVSAFSKKDIVNRYGIEESKIDVIPNGAGNDFLPLTEEEKEFVKHEYAGGCDYFLFISALQPRKNILRLLKAFDQMKLRDDRQLKLLIAGGHTWIKNEINEVLQEMEYHDQVIFLDHLTRQELAKVLGAALALTYVSLFEGFGIPILEAMNCQVPVITSNISSMPEVAGNAAEYVDPYSVESIARGMENLYSHPERRNELINLGNIQKKNFSWDISALKMWESIEKVVDVSR